MNTDLYDFGDPFIIIGLLGLIILLFIIGITHGK